MDDKEKEEEAKKKAEEEAEEKRKAEAEEKANTGNKGEGKSPLDQAEEINKKKEELLEREEKMLERKEKLEASRRVGGGSEAGKEPEKPEKLTDTEYAEALERGEVNPLKEDGFIN